MIRTLTISGLLFGLTVLIFLVAWQGFAEVSGILAASGGWLLVLPFVWLPALFIGAAGWRLQFRPRTAPAYLSVVRAQWIGRSVNVLFPVAQLGGDIVRVRLLCLRGADIVPAAASVVVDKAAQATAAVLWGLIGISLLASLSLDDGLVAPALAAAALLAAGVCGFVLLQRAGMFGFAARFARLLDRGDRAQRLADHAQDLDREIRAAHGRKRRFAAACLVRTLGLAAQTFEVWLAAWLLGHGISFVEALLLKSMSSILTDVMFFVPNGYGVQEGAYVVIGGAIGLTPDFMLALSLSTRIRDVVIDVPGLIAWQHSEGRHLLRRARGRPGAAMSGPAEEQRP